MNQYTTIIPKDYIFFEEIIEQRLAKYGVRTRFNSSQEVSTLEIFLNEDPANTIEVIECENSIALFRTSSQAYNETIQKLIGALENEFYTFMIYLESYKIPVEVKNFKLYSELVFSENETCFVDDFMYKEVLEKYSNPNSLKIPERRDIFEDDLPLKIEMGLSLIAEDPTLLAEENKNKLLIKINAMYRDIAIRFGGPKKSLDIVDWAFA
jgi:hypothetical protein